MASATVSSPTPTVRSSSPPMRNGDRSCQLRFNGMWAFAIWDARDRRLFLSRDRFGVKPLHYSNHAGAFVFASELKAFLTVPWIDGTFDPEILTETLANIGGHESTPYTLFPGVLRLPAGHAMLVESDGSIRINAWWNTLDHLPQPRASLNEQAEEFRALFFDACRLRLRSDVPLATALSGGLDSSAIACTLAELGRRGVVEHAPRTGNARSSRASPVLPTTSANMRRTSSTIPAWCPITSMSMTSRRLKISKGSSSIMKKSIGIHAVGPWMVYRAMRFAGIRVSIDGHGSDEMIGGYHLFVERAMDAAVGSLDLRRYLDLRGVLAGLSWWN